MARTGLTLAKKQLAPLLESLAAKRSEGGVFDWHELVPDVQDQLQTWAIADDPAAVDALYEVARVITSDFFRDRTPQIPKETAQLALFYDPNAYLTLGAAERIRMGDAKSEHVERWRAVETQNFEGQSSAFFFKMRYIDDRLPKLREDDCTLDELEGNLIEE